MGLEKEIDITFWIDIMMRSCYKAWIWLVFALLLLLRMSRCVDVIYTIAGGGTSYYYGIGDGYQATWATMNPSGLALDSSGRTAYKYIILHIILQIIALLPSPR